MQLRLRYTVLAAAAAASLLIASPARALCVTCNSLGECVAGRDGDYCGLWWAEGRWWCNWYDPCTVGVLTPQDFAPSGTFLADATVERNGLKVVSCNGYVAGHATSSEDADVLGEIRI